MSDFDPRNDPTPWLERWRLSADGDRIVTHSSVLVPALRGEQPVMLKLTQEPDEQIGGAVLAWWQGHGVVDVLERENGVLLMERPTGPDSLYRRALAGEDSFAIDILCETASALHSHQPADPPRVPTLEEWFVDLLETSDARPEVLEGRRILDRLLATGQDNVMLHGDIHHRNVLQSMDGRWLAIDPKGIYGERTYDYLNIFRNPNTSIATDPERFDARIDQITRRAQLDRRRLLEWIAAFCALSLAWDYYPEGSPEADLTVARFALGRLKSER
ncbi:MAG TPA: aminoglycoside phosphotransferase family protein [Thermomicrobiales bacterium]|nr:aminoglycoside phosphotransferase family protein [Thermomicrobiales bacterium]